MSNWLTRVGVGVFDAVFRPSRLVTAASGKYANPAARTGYTSRLFGIYLVNILLYAVPLTAVGIGVQPGTNVPRWVATLTPSILGDPRPLWQLTRALLQNSAYLIAGTALTFATYHVGVLLTRSSQGSLSSLHTVIYSTSAYLAGIFTIVWILSTNPAVIVARAFVIDVQKWFIYTCIDLLQADVGLSGGRPDTISLAGASPLGTFILALLPILGVYYLYSLYLGTRLNHRASRLTALLIVLAVAVSPALYVFGSILAATSLGIHS